MKCVRHLFLIALLLVCANSARGVGAPEWIRQLGSARYDLNRAISADALGNIFITGETGGSLVGSNAGDFDIFACKYNLAGTRVWTRQLGTSGTDASYTVSADGLGNAYIGGSTAGNLLAPNAGNVDAVLIKYNSAGSIVWSRQFGTANDDEVASVSVDHLGNIYVAGDTTGSLGGPHWGGSGTANLFISKYDAAGNLLWIRQPDSESFGNISADGLGNIYLARSKPSDPANPVGDFDAFVSKYDGDGNLLWTRQLGSTFDDSVYGVSADSLGNIFVTGSTVGNLGGLSAGTYDAFIGKYDASGSLLWIRQLGTPATDQSFAVSADGYGNVYIGGETYGNLGGTNSGGDDAWVAKYSGAGSLVWTRQLGTSENDWSTGVSFDGVGNVYVGGGTQGSLGGSNAGFTDSFVAKIVDPVPEPRAFALSAICVSGIATGTRRKTANRS